MNDLWFISDTHFGHSNILSFVNYDGDRTRPDFDSVEEMDERLVENWNSMVKPNDKIYHLGDVAFDRSVYVRIMQRLNGRKRLILGNHDKFSIDLYARFFEKIMESWQPTSNMLFTHRPILINPRDKVKVNVHGHVHRIRQQVSPSHFNVSVEMTNYFPIHWDEIHSRLGIENLGHR